MEPTLIVTIIVFILMVVSFILNKIPMALTALIGMLVLVIAGCVEPAEALGNIGSSVTITMVSMFVIAAGLARTKMVKHLSGLVYKVSRGSFTKTLAGYVLVTFILGQFLSSTTVVFTIVIPLVISTCKELNLPASKMIYSIALTAVSASFTIQPIGPIATGFIEDNGLLAAYGITGYEFDMLSQTVTKIPLAIFVLIWAIFLAPKFAPDNPVVPVSFLDQNITDEKREPLGPVREVIGYVVFFAVIVCFFFRSFGLPNWVIPMAGACTLVVTGVLKGKEAINSMRLEIVLLYVGVVTLGNAFANTGAGELIGDLVAGMLNGVTNSYAIGAIFFIASFFMTTVLYNRAVSKILIPLALLTSISMDCDPRGLVIICYMGTMCSLLMPMSTSVVPIMMHAGGYTQKTLLKMGWLPSILMGVVTVLTVMSVYPCY